MASCAQGSPLEDGFVMLVLLAADPLAREGKDEASSN